MFDDALFERRLSATASVIAILTVAVNSAQFISRVVNRSNYYRDRARTAVRLHSTLKQIADIIVKNKQTDDTNNGSACRRLGCATYVCMKDLPELQGSLSKLKRTSEKSIGGVLSDSQDCTWPQQIAKCGPNSQCSLDRSYSSLEG